MLKKLLHQLLSHRHFWRDTTFNELNEIYVAMLVRGMSLSMIGLFMPVYMLKLGYSLRAFLFVQVCYFVARVLADFASAHLVARFGPKHVLVLGQVIFSVASVLMLTLQQMDWPLWLIGAVWGSSQSCFFVAFDVDFSKIKHKLHGGKELGYVEIMSKIGSVVGPLLGGVVGFVAGPQYIFLVSTVLLVVGLRPLFFTKEPTQLKQQLRYREFDAKHLKQFMLPLSALYIENTLSVMLWPMFLALFVLPGNSVFIKLGVLSAVSMALSIVAAHVIGHLVDRRQGRRVLRVSAVVNALLHLLRPFVGAYSVAVGVNTVNEIITLGYRLPFLKAYYDQADNYPGQRIVFISSMEALASFCKGVVYGFLLLISYFVSVRATLVIAFCIAAVASLLVTTERFETLKPKAKG